MGKPIQGPFMQISKSERAWRNVEKQMCGGWHCVSLPFNFCPLAVCPLQPTSFPSCLYWGDTTQALAHLAWVRTGPDMAGIPPTFPLPILILSSWPGINVFPIVLWTSLNILLDRKEGRFTGYKWPTLWPVENFSLKSNFPVGNQTPNPPTVKFVF